MGLCPKCNQSIDHDFGVVVCPGCESVLFADFDGNLQISGGESQELASQSEALTNADSQATAFEAREASEPEFSGDFSTDSSTDSSNREAPFLEAQYTDPPAAESQIAESPNQLVEKEESSTISDENFQNMEAAGSDFLNSPAQSPAEQIQEVEDFANSAPDEDHALQYTLTIDHIDSKETRQRLFEILGDIRLGLSVRELQTRVVKGRLEIEQLNPVRASVIVARLRELPVLVRWKQDVWKA